MGEEGLRRARRGELMNTRPSLLKGTKGVAGGREGRDCLEERKGTKVRCH